MTNCADYRALRTRWQQLAADLADRRARARELAQREQLLKLGLAEIAAVAPQPGEDEKLIAEAKRLENADGLRSAAEEALVSLSGVGDLCRHRVRDPAGGGAGPGGPARPGRIRRPAAGRTGRRTAAGIGHPGRCRRRTLRLPCPTWMPIRPGCRRCWPGRRRFAALTRRYGEDVDAVLAWADAGRPGTAEPGFLRAPAGRIADRTRCAAGRGCGFGAGDFGAPGECCRPARQAGHQRTGSAGDGPRRCPGSGRPTGRRQRATPMPYRSTDAGAAPVPMASTRWTSC